MSEPSSSAHSGQNANHGDSSNPPTVAAFAPNSQPFSTKQRSTILVHHKTPLLLATPPQVTRALAYSHPFIAPLNKLFGLLSWTTGDPWESFLLVSAFWFTVLYGDDILRYAGPLLLVMFLIAGMYFRRYSPLSSTGWTGEKQSKTHKREPSDAHIKHRKSLDEILGTLQTFTTRCNILLDPMLRMTDFLSTQQTATSATTRPALTALFIRILLASPVWLGLTLPPFRIITTKRIVLVFGTMVLSWHSRPARISRMILWRSRTVRLISSAVTGLTFGSPSDIPPPLPSRTGQMPYSAAMASKQGVHAGEGIRFTFSVYENQRRWLGIGWTGSMLAYERAPWTDEHLNPTADIHTFVLPDVDGGMAQWRWVGGSEWHVANGPNQDTSSGKGSAKDKAEAATDEDAQWVYYDNKWLDGRRGSDGWSRYTRRRKWIRDAELVDVDPASEETAARPKSPNLALGTEAARLSVDSAATADYAADIGSPAAGVPGSKQRRGWFARSPADGPPKDVMYPKGAKAGSAGGSVQSHASSGSRTMLPDDDVLTPTARLKEKEAEWGLGDDVYQELG